MVPNVSNHDKYFCDETQTKVTWKQFDTGDELNLSIYKEMENCSLKFQK